MTFRTQVKDLVRGAQYLLQRSSEARARAAEKARRTDPFQSLNSSTYVAALLIAGCTTFIGLLGIFRDANPAAGVTPVLFAGAATTILFLGQNWALTLWRSYRPWRWAGIPFYVLFALPSIAFSFAFWWSLLNARDHTVREARTTVASVLRTADSVDASLNTLIRTTDNLASYSKSESGLESVQGGTCGDGSHGDRGPRAILREQDSQSLGAASSYVKQLAEPTDRALAALRQDVAQVSTRDFAAKSAREREGVVGELNQRLDSVGQLVDAASHDQRLLAYRGEFQDRLAKEAAPMTAKGVTFTCHDATLRSSLAGAIAAINSLAGSPSLSGLRIDFNEGGKANLFALNRLQNTFFRDAPALDRAAVVAARRLVAQGGSGEPTTQQVSDPSADAGRLEGRDWGLLFVAVFFDALIAGTGFSKARNPVRQLNSAASAAQDQSYDAISRVLADLKDQGSALGAMVGPYCVAYAGLEYLIVPLRPFEEKPPAGHEQTPFLVQNVAALLSAAGLAREISPIPPLRRELLIRLDLAMGMVVADQPEPVFGHADATSRHRAWRLISFGAGRAANRWFDREHEARKRNYSFYLVQSGVIRVLRLRTPPTVS